jgi:hypothetical protein
MAPRRVVDELPNGSTVGTGDCLLVTVVNEGGLPKAIMTSAGQTYGAIGICDSNPTYTAYPGGTCGTTGQAIIKGPGLEVCSFDAPAPGDYLTISPTVAGECHDAGTTRPTATQNLGIIGARRTGNYYAVSLSIDP